MRSMPLALLWETLYRGRWSLLSFFLLGMLMPMAFYAQLSQLTIEFKNDRAFIAIQCAFLVLMLFLFAIGVTHAFGSFSRLFALPISANSIVAWNILAGASLLGLEATAAGCLLNWQLDLNWPIWGSVLYAAAAWSVFQFLLCATIQPSVSSFVLGMAPLAWLSLWLHARYGAWFSRPTHYWTEVTALEYVTLISVVAISYPFSVWGISRVRCGEVLPSLGFRAWLVRIWDSLYRSNDKPPFKSVALAQFWIEWTQKGLALPILVGLEMLFAGFVGTCAWLASQNSWHQVYEGILFCGGLLSLLAMGAGFILGMNLNAGSVGQRNARLGEANGLSDSMGHFLSTRPLSNLDFAQAILKTAAISTLIAWAIWFIAFVAILGIMWSALQLPSPMIPPKMGAWFLPLTLFVPWIFMSNLPSIGLSGRGILIAFAVVIGLSILLILSIVVGVFVSAAAVHQLHIISTVIVCTLIVCATVLMFAKVYREKIYRATALTAFAITWCGSVIAAIALSPVQLDFSICIAIFAFAALIVLPFATTPLAIAWNRHR